jgi:hypothetical protein
MQPNAMDIKVLETLIFACPRGWPFFGKSIAYQCRLPTEKNTGRKAAAQQKEW